MTDAQLIAILAGAPSKVMAVVAPLPEEELRRRPAEGEWSIKEVMCHLRDAAEHLGRRVSRIAVEENPYLPEWDQDAAAREGQYQDEITPNVLLRYVENRAPVVELLRALPAERWERRGNHWKNGDVTLRSVAEGMAKHDLEHIAQIRRLAKGK